MSTYEPIAIQTLGSAAASVTFSSIPQGYTDLVVVMNVISSSTAANYIYVQYNNDTGSNYSTTILSGDGSSAQSARSSNRTNFNIDYYATPNTEISNRILQIQNYSNSTTFKTGLVRANRAGGGTDAIVGLWRSTAAINQLKITHDTANFASGSTFSLYGIQVGDKAQKAQGGNIVTTDGTYVYHTFTSSGAFIPNQALTVDYLVVAGGGGGGADYVGVAGTKGGGGAGGLRSTVTATGGGGSLESALSLSSGKSYPVIVGAGGAAASTSSNTRTNAGANGNDSVFSTITSTGGGGGAGGGYPATNGGSGGGAGYGNGTTTAGTGTANQGYAGGAAVVGANSGGGGGGAGGVGSTGRNTGNGGGGNGVAVSISGSSVTYAGGGGAGAGDFAAGAGGTGGGGAGGVAGTANTGGGGGGNAAGGSGIVIIRYAI